MFMNVLAVLMLTFGPPLDYLLTYPNSLANVYYVIARWVPPATATP